MAVNAVSIRQNARYQSNPRDGERIDLDEMKRLHAPLLALVATVAVLTGGFAWADDRSGPGTSTGATSRGSEAFEPALASPFPLASGQDAFRFDPVTAPARRPRLSVTMTDLPAAGGALVSQPPTPAFSWSLDAWEMNTASLAHIQCNRATRTIEAFLVEDCRFVDQPPPADAGSLVQVRGQWLAAPGLQIGAGAFAGRQLSPTRSMPVRVEAPPGMPTAETVEGINMNVSFGLSTGRVGDLLVDLQLERYRRSAQTFASGPLDAFGGSYGALSRFGPSGRGDFQTAGQLGIGWRLDRFRADVTGQYRQLPIWLGEQTDGDGFNSFDIELSWRAPANSSISVGVTNVLDQRPRASESGESNLDDSIESIYGRIPYVRYKHDL